MVKTPFSSSIQVRSSPHVPLVAWGSSESPSVTGASAGSSTGKSSVSSTVSSAFSSDADTSSIASPGVDASGSGSLTASELSSAGDTSASAEGRIVCGSTYVVCSGSAYSSYSSAEAGSSLASAPTGRSEKHRMIARDNASSFFMCMTSQLFNEQNINNRTNYKQWLMSCQHTDS